MYGEMAREQRAWLKEQNGVRLGHWCTSSLLESDISLSQFEKLARKKVFKSCLNDLNFYSNKLLVFAISHPACQPYEQRIYFLFQAVLLSRWAGCHVRTWLCFQVICGGVGGGGGGKEGRNRNDHFEKFCYSSVSFELIFKLCSKI